MAEPTQDPAVRWADLLQELTGARRDAVVSALRYSAESGWPASRDSVVSLVAYAQGRIGAREYAAQTLIALGLADADSASAFLDAASTPPAEHESVPAPAPMLPTRSSGMDAGLGAEFLLGRPDLASPGRSDPRSREGVARAYVTGRLPLEDFLRAAREDFI